MNRQPFVATLLVASLMLASSTQAQMTPEKRIQAKDGDLIVVEDADRVRFVRRRQADVRAIYQPQLKKVVLLIDFAAGHAAPAGQVDEVRTFEELQSDWPFGDRWEGRATIEEYWIFAPHMRSQGIGLATPMGVVRIGGPESPGWFGEGAVLANVVSYKGGSSPGRGLSFDEAERQALSGWIPFSVTADLTMAPGGVAVMATPPTAAPQPVRVGGNIPAPVKIRDVRPVYPDAARAKGISGLVILEAIISADGGVTSARVLKSIPELDAAAIEAVRQWRFEPTLLNGVPVPVIMTVTVNFSLQ